MSKARTLSLAAVSLSLATAATLAFGMADFREQVSTEQLGARIERMIAALEGAAGA